MGIQISNPDTTPSLVYDRVFLCQLHIAQVPSEDDAAPPRYDTKIEYRMFAVDENGKRHYRSKSDSVRIPDYYTAALIKAQQGDPDLANAMSAIEKAVASILADQTGLTGVSVI